MIESSNQAWLARGAAVVGLLCLGSAAQAVALFQQNFATGLSGFTAAGPVTTGAFGVRMAGTFGGVDGVVTSPTFSTSGFSNIRLSFTRATSGLDSGEVGVAQVSINGGAFQTVDQQRTINAPTTINLGAAAANASVRLRFAISASNGLETYTVSNVLVEGDAAGGGGGTPSCTNLAPGDFNCTIASAGGNRTYLVHVPPGYSRTTAVPLVIDMHGFTSTAGSQRSVSGWLQLSDSKTFIAAWPQGLQNAWNAQGQCCGSSNVDDPQFIRDVVSAIKAAANIAAPKVWVTGLSNGGSMTHTMACSAADVFSAAGPVSFTLSGGSTTAQIIANCQPSRPIAVIEFHGTADNVVPFNTGVLDSIGAQASLNAWIQVQQCSATATRPRLTSNTTCELHAGCGGTANQVGLCTVQGGVHVLYPSVPAPGIASFLYDFFQAQPSR